MSMTVSKLRGLVEALYHHTLDQNLVWSLSSDKERVSTNIEEYKIEVSEETNDRFASDIRVMVFNKDGDVVDTFTDAYFDKMEPASVPNYSYFGVMSTLLETARRQASGADAAIDRLLSSLGAKPIIETPRNQLPHNEDDAPF